MIDAIAGASEAERLFDDAAVADADGRTEDAIILYRRAAMLGHLVAQSNLGVELTNLGGAHTAEGIRWLKTSARMGNDAAAWNLAMEHRLAGKRTAYLYWMRCAARLGNVEALLVIEDIDRRRAHREPWFMLKSAFVDAADLEWALDDVCDGARSPTEVASWAEGIVRRRHALGLVPEDQPRLFPVLWEMARPGLTPQRAAELIMKLAG